MRVCFLCVFYVSSWSLVSVGIVVLIMMLLLECSDDMGGLE